MIKKRGLCRLMEICFLKCREIQKKGAVHIQLLFSVRKLVSAAFSASSDDDIIVHDRLQPEFSWRFGNIRHQYVGRVILVAINLVIDRICAWDWSKVIHFSLPCTGLRLEVVHGFDFQFNRRACREYHTNRIDLDNVLADFAWGHRDSLCIVMYRAADLTLFFIKRITCFQRSGAAYRKAGSAGGDLMQFYDEVGVAAVDCCP